MEDPNENTLAKKSPQKGGSIASTDSAATPNSPSLKDVLALGSAIVRELHLDTRGELLQRWMAHHLADLIAKAEQALGPEKADHERAATDLILKLWLHRRGLPQQADPLAGYSEALKVLKQLRPESNPWLRFHRQDPYMGEIRKMFDSMSCAVVGGIALTQLSSPQMADESQAKFIDPLEATLLEAFEQWHPTAVETPNVKIVFVEAGSSFAADQEGAIAVGDGSSATGESENRIDEEAALKSNIAKHLTEVHTQLGRLIDAWNTASEASAEEGDD